MQRILGWLGKGLLAVVPITLTVAALIWLVTTAEGLVAPWIRWAFGADDYVPGSGLLLVGLGLVGVGMLVDRVIGAWVLDLVDRLVDRVPLVKSFYGAVRDVLRFVVPGRREEESRRVVAWSPREEAWMIGFVTGEALFRAPGEEVPRVSVYFPMSYQVGGYTLVLPEAELVPLEMSVEDAMRAVLTAGMAASGTR